GSGEHHAGRGHLVGHRRQHLGRCHEPVLVGVEGEHRTSHQVGRRLLDLAHVEVAVLDVYAKVPLLEGSAQHLVLSDGYTATEHHGFGAAADPCVQGAHQGLVGGGVGHVDFPDLPLTGGAHPERTSGPSHVLPSSAPVG